MSGSCLPGCAPGWLRPLLAAECASWALCPALCLPLLGLFVLLAAGVLGSAAAYFARRQKRLEEAAAQVRALLDGDATARLDSGREGQLYRLFHEVNEMAAVLNAHADREQREKQFLKNTMADISHQLKTPLAALNIYNGLLQAGTDDAENVRELAELSEQELDRMEQLVQKSAQAHPAGCGDCTAGKNGTRSARSAGADCPALCLPRPAGAKAAGRRGRAGGVPVL